MKKNNQQRMISNNDDEQALRSFSHNLHVLE